MVSVAGVILYDGVCGLCHRLVQFVLARDHRGAFRFAPLQGAFARAVLLRHGKDPDDLDTVYLVIDPDLPSERLLWAGRAVVAILRRLGGAWRLAGVLAVLPAGALDAAYRVISTRRYRWFGKLDQCALPAPELHERFIEGFSR